MWKNLVIFSSLCLSCFASDLKISVYYESLCPDSIHFFKTQFPEVFDLYEDQIIVDLVPFGFATASNETGTWVFTCQHGDEECYGNKIQSCALSMYPGKTSIEFVECAMNSSDASLDTNLDKCAGENEISWQDLQECISSGKADELLNLNGLRTAEVTELSFMPTIVYDDLYNDILQDLSLTDFLEVVEILLSSD